jgi:uncharacterized membrane protein YqjE
MGKFEGESIFRLVARFVSLARRFFTQEKAYVKEVVQGAVKTSLPAIILVVVGLVLMALAGIFLLVTLVLVLNIWFLPWVSALIVTAVLMVGGLILVFVGLRTAQKEFGKTRTKLDRVRGDMKWLRKS